MRAGGSWQGKTVLITGGSSSKGRLIAQRFLQEGAFVVLVDIDMDYVKAMASDFNALSFLTLKADVSKPADCYKAVETCINISGSLDLLINAAGARLQGNSVQASEADWDRIIDVNLKGTFFMCRYAIPHLEKTHGSIINMSSYDSLSGTAGAAIYGASKAGVNILTQSLALELAPLGIRVNAICPCYMGTPATTATERADIEEEPRFFQRDLLAMNPTDNQMRLAEPEEIANFVFSVSGPHAAPTTGACMPIELLVSVA